MAGSENKKAAKIHQSMKQRDKMRELYARFGDNKDRCVAAYAAAERRGEVVRTSKQSGKTPEAYASGLFNEGLEFRKGWLLR